MRTSRRYQLRLRATLDSELESYAGRHGLSLASAIRLLIGRGLEAESIGEAATRDSPAALAGLTAAEHAVLMVASVLPEGERRMLSLAGQAVQAAEERLALFRDQPSGAEVGRE